MHTTHFLFDFISLATADMDSAVSQLCEPCLHGAIGEICPAILIDKLGAGGTGSPLGIAEVDYPRGKGEGERDWSCIVDFRHRRRAAEVAYLAGFAYLWRMLHGHSFPSRNGGRGLKLADHVCDVFRRIDRNADGSLNRFVGISPRQRWETDAVSVARRRFADL